jgi:hypothetical protein
LERQHAKMLLERALAATEWLDLVTVENPKIFAWKQYRLQLIKIKDTNDFHNLKNWPKPPR